MAAAVCSGTRQSTCDRRSVRIPCVVVLSVALLACQFGCTVRTGHTVTDAEMKKDPAEAFDDYDQVKAVILKTGERIEFEKPGGFYSRTTRTIVGTTVDGEKVRIDVNDCVRVEVSRVSGGLTELGEFTTGLLIVAGILAVVVIVDATTPPF